MAIIGTWVNIRTKEGLVEEVLKTRFNTDWPSEEIIENVYYIIDAFHLVRKYDSQLEFDIDTQPELYNISSMQFFGTSQLDFEEDEYFGGGLKADFTTPSEEQYRLIINSYAYKTKGDRDDRESVIEKFVWIDLINKDEDLGKIWEISYNKLKNGLKNLMEKRLEGLNLTGTITMEGDQ